MEWIFDDGGRAEAGYKGRTGDCVCRAIAIATQRPYKEVYDLINEYGKQERTGKRKKGKSSARSGVYKETVRKVMEHYGWVWHPTMFIGQGCKVHLDEKELPKGRLVVSLSKHEVAVIDGVIHDTYDPSRDGSRCVYGYYTPRTIMKSQTGKYELVVVWETGEKEVFEYDTEKDANTAGEGMEKAFGRQLWWCVRTQYE